MQDQVRIGVIGTSGFTEFVHLTDLKSHPQARVTAICGRRDRKRAAEMATTYDIPYVYTDYREMLGQAPLDAVIVAAPDDLHYPIVMEALDAGLHVLCEKPLASNVEQARAMLEKAEAAGVKHMVFFTWPWLDHWQHVQRLLTEGYVGRPRHCEVTYLGSQGLDPQYNWRFDGRRGNGVLADLGAHAIQFARLYVGEVTRVCAHLRNFIERTDPEGQPVSPANDSAQLIVEFANGAHGIIQLSAVAHKAGDWLHQRIVIHGDAGSLEAELTNTGRRLRGARSGAESYEDFGTRVFGPEDGAFGGIFDVFRSQSVGDRQFIDAILEDKRPGPSFYDGVKVQEVIDAALASHRAERWVTLSGT